MKHSKHQNHRSNGQLKIRSYCFFRDNSLTIVLSLLFLGCLAAQCFLTWHSAKNTVSFWQTLHSSTFIDGLATNWQAAFLQLVVLIAFSSFLVQRGAAHSRKPGSSLHASRGHAKQKRHTNWIYNNSLLLAFFALFLLSMAAHAWCGWRAFHQSLVKDGRQGISFKAYLCSKKFWSSNFQTWQAEFLAIALFVCFSVFLREKGSAESKPVGASDGTTGKVNK